MEIHNKTIKRIQEVRRKNNILWCKLLDIAIEHAPEEAKEIFDKIVSNDKKIIELSKELVG